MTTLMLALPLSNPIRGPVKKRRVLLVDTSPSKRELRAETMRRLGMDVDCAADISEARSWWRADLYNLVLINMENEQGHRDKFCDDMRSATPPQQLAFLVGKPEYLADSPNTNGASSVKNTGGIPPQDEVRIVTDRETGRARGFAFVEMTNPGEAEKAIAALNGTELGGRTLTINEAKPKPERPRGGGQRFGGGGGRGRDDYRGHPRQPREPRW